LTGTDLCDIIDCRKTTSPPGRSAIQKYLTRLLNLATLLARVARFSFI